MRIKELSLDGESAHVLIQFSRQFLEVFTLLLVTKSDGDTMLTSSGCSTDSMDISLWLSWETEVDDGMNIWDIKASSNNISGDQEANFAALEIFNGLETL
jgi:hypothetical protein